MRARAEPWILLAVLSLGCGDGKLDPCEGIGCSDRGLCNTDGVTAWCECEQYYVPRVLECVLKDMDGDGYADEQDNCPPYWNEDQRDSNRNGAGDACEPRYFDGAPYGAPVGARLHDGRIAFAGVFDGPTEAEGSWRTDVYVYDPGRDSFEQRSSNLQIAHADGTAVTLLDGDVLFIGGANEDGEPDSAADLWDPETDQVTNVGPTQFARTLHQAVLLEGGDVLVVGGMTRGVPSPPLERFAQGRGFEAGLGLWSGPDGPFGILPGVVELADGRVLIAGGIEACDEGTPPGSGAVIYDPRHNRFDPLDGGLAKPRFGHSMVLVPDGGVLVVGGLSSPCETENIEPVREIEYFDPTTAEFGTIGEASGHAAGAVVMLADGTVLALGGFDDGLAAHPRATRIRADGPIEDGPLVPGSLQVPRAWIQSASFLLEDGSVVVIGGRAERERFAQGAERLFPPYDLVVDEDHDRIVDVLDPCPKDPSPECGR